MNDSSTIYLTIAVFSVYILFAVGLLLVKQRIKSGKVVKASIVAPILFSFFTGMGFLMYALSQI